MSRRKPGQGRRPRLGRPHHHVGPDRAAAGHHRRWRPGGDPGRMLQDLGVLEEPDAASLDGVGQAAGQERRLQRGAVRRERRAQARRRRRSVPASRLARASAGRLRPHPSARASSTSASARGRAGPRCAPGRPSRPWRSGSRCPRRPRWRRRRQRCPPWRGAWRAWRSRPCWRASAASEVANKAEHQPPLRPDAPNPATSRSTTTTRKVGSASASAWAVQKPGEPGADDADVDLEILAERRAGRQRGRDGLPPQGQPLVPRAGSRARTCDPGPRPALHPAPRLGEHLAQRGRHEVDLLLAADERWGQLHHGVAAVVGPADQPGLEERAREEAAQQALGLLVVEGLAGSSLSLTSSIP